MDLMHGESFREVVFVNGTFYLLDMRYTPDHGNECMAFECDFNGNVLSSNEVWVKTGMPLTKKEMNRCCSEFIHFMRRWKEHVKNLPDRDLIGMAAWNTPARTTNKEIYFKF